MTALTADRDTPVRDGTLFEWPVAAGVRIYTGALVVLKDGHVQPATTATGLTAVGRAEAQADNSADVAGAIRVRVRRGVFRFANASADPVRRSHIGGSAYAVDDQTVAATDGTNTRSAAGTVRDVDDTGVWIEL